MEVKVCSVCGKQFETENKLLQVCSADCKRERQVMINRWNRKKRREELEKVRAESEKKCPTCGKIFHSGRSNKIFCCNLCYERDKNMRIAEERRGVYKKKPVKPKKTLEQLCKEAREHGMDYGNYVVWLERNGG